MTMEDGYSYDDTMSEIILDALRNSLSKHINDVTAEGDHIIVTVDTAGNRYRSVRLDVTDLGPDYLEHD